MEMVREQGRKVGGAAGSVPSHTLGTPTIRRFSGEPFELDNSQDAAQDRYKQNDRMLRHELVQKLISSILVAKGSPIHDDDHRFERAIPSLLWKGLELDIGNSEASGRGWRYGAVKYWQKADVGGVEMTVKKIPILLIPYV